MFYFRHISNWDFIGPQRFKHTIAVIEACEHTHTHADFFIDFSIRMYACVEFCDVKKKKFLEKLFGKETVNFHIYSVCLLLTLVVDSPLLLPLQK